MMDRRRLWLMWWSGLLAAACFVHLLRVMVGLPVRFGTWQVPMEVSWIVFPLAGLVSLWLVRKGRGVG